jgi:hypothetical protein
VAVQDFLAAVAPRTRLIVDHLCHDTPNMPLYVAENPVGRKQPMIHSVIPEYLLAFYSHWLFPVHRISASEGRTLLTFSLIYQIPSVPVQYG